MAFGKFMQRGVSKPFGRRLDNLTGATEARRLENEQQEIARISGEREAERLGTVRASYGVLTPGLSAEGRGGAHERRALFGSAIESNVGAGRDNALLSLTDQMTEANNEAEFSASRSGLLGGSIDQANRRNLLAVYGANRASIASGAQGQRENANQALSRERIQMENAVRTNGQQGLEQLYAAGQGLSAINSAKASLPLQTAAQMAGGAGTGIANLYGSGAFTGNSKSGSGKSAEPTSLIPGSQQSQTGGT